MSHIWIPKGAKSLPDEGADSYDKALSRHIAAFKEDVRNLSETEGITENDAMIFVLQSRVFNLLVNQEKLVWELKKPQLKLMEDWEA